MVPFLTLDQVTFSNQLAWFSFGVLTKIQEFGVIAIHYKFKEQSRGQIRLSFYLKPKSFKQHDDIKIYKRTLRWQDWQLNQRIHAWIHVLRN